MADDNDDDGILGKLILSAAVVIGAIPGLIIEPGPVSETFAVGLLAIIWFPEGSDTREAVEEAT